jgi:PhnB protein
MNIIPMLAFQDAATAITFYKNVFGGTESNRMTNDNGQIEHAEMKIGEGLIMLADEFPEHNSSPTTLGGSSVILMVYVDDVDETAKKAEAKGAEILEPPADQFFGARLCKIRDPFGYKWFIATRL